MKVLGGVLVVLGILALIYGGVSWTRKDTVVDAGPIQITADKKESIPISPIARRRKPTGRSSFAPVTVSAS